MTPATMACVVDSAGTFSCVPDPHASNDITAHRAVVRITNGDLGAAGAGDNSIDTSATILSVDTSGADGSMWIDEIDGLSALWLSAENADIQALIKKAQDAGVHVTACKACADQLGATEALEKMDVEVIYWGEPLTSILKSGETLLTI